mmetsp:Transcript_21329/g.73565  ORF Transcript_21329/g.73565 Transcript_21329/m.73565 type:complete len:223 (-) Transcript_21329:696-1364(-)
MRRRRETASKPLTTRRRRRTRCTGSTRLMRTIKTARRASGTGASGSRTRASLAATRRCSRGRPAPGRASGSSALRSATIIHTGTRRRGATWPSSSTTRTGAATTAASRKTSRAAGFAQTRSTTTPPAAPTPNRIGQPRPRAGLHRHSASPTRTRAPTTTAMSPAAVPCRVSTGPSQPTSRARACSGSGTMCRRRTLTRGAASPPRRRTRRSTRATTALSSRR